MPRVSINFGDGATLLPRLDFDAVLQETDTDEAEITEFPVEEGLPTSDTIRRKPASVSLEVLLSDEPAIGEDAETGRADTAYRALLNAQQLGRAVALSGGRRRYPVMGIASIGMTRDAATAGVVRLAITLREVRAVRAESIAQPRKAPPNAVVKAPTKTPEKASTKEDEQVQSVYSEFSDAASDGVDRFARWVVGP